jgi:hypothetical protein
MRDHETYRRSPLSYLRFTLAAISVFASIPARGLIAQQPVHPVDFKPFSDGRTWIVKEPLIYRVGISKDSVVVPVGFVTDLASIPPALQSIIQQNGRYLLPAVVHDYLYWQQTCTRAQSDQILRLAMIEHKVGTLHRVAIYDAVRAAGRFAWADNAHEHSQHQLRIIPAAYLQIPADTTWEQYRQRLMRNGVFDPPSLPIPPGFCARGSMPSKTALTTP